MPPQTAKLVPPTVETCRWRHPPRNGASAECGLIASLTGVSSATVVAVAEDACAACCQSFPPSKRKLNPVVASLLHTAATRIADAGGMDGCSAGEAARLRGVAEAALNLTYPERFRVTPARSIADCCWRGALRPAAGNCSPDAEPQFDCRHPAHDVASAAICRVCRDWTRQPNVSRFLSLPELIPPPERRCGPPVRRWAVGVTTSGRRHPTLEQCLDALVRSGWNEPRLFLDGFTPLPERYGHLPVTWREEGVGAWPAWYLALAELLTQQPDADAYVLLQDDVVLYDREPLREYLEQILWPGDRLGVISLFYTGVDTVPGRRCSQGEWHWGAQGFVFPQAIVRAFFGDAELTRTWLSASPQRHVPIPEVLCGWVERQGIDMWYAIPSPTQHIGNTSTLWMDAAISGGRRASWFSGSLETDFAAEESLAEFPEEAFPCRDALRDDYLARVEMGRQRMSESSVVVCGLCRDVRHYLPRTAARIERLGEMFRDYRVVLFENDSVDATREFLQDWKAHNPRVSVISETLGVRRFPQTRSPDRASFLARCRNRCRERVVAEHGDFDWVIVLDTDLPGGWSFDGLAHTFGNDDWDFVGSYGLRRQLATRSEAARFTHVDVWAFRPARGTAPRKLVNHNELHLARGEPFLPVESCFGGLGVYRMACLRAADYGGRDCEHVVFHERLRQAGISRLFMNPSQIVLYSPF